MTAAHIDDPSGSLGTERDSLSDRIYARLRYALMSGFYEPGSRLSIRRLATTNNTSATPVREAVFQLVREGALELKLGHQPRVPELTEARYVEIRETRAPLERLAAELATARLTDADIARLHDLHKAFTDSEADQNWKAAMIANQEFHFSIYRSSGNEILVRTIENLWLLSGPFVNHQYPLPEISPFAVHPHLLILDALGRRAPSEVGDIIVRDLREGVYLIMQRVRLRKEARRSKHKTGHIA